MQAISGFFKVMPYDFDMQIGRPSKRQRTLFGERIYLARLAAGLSQEQVAEQLGLKQAGYAAWERDSVSLRPEQLAKLATILNLSAEELLGLPAPKVRGNGPVGKAKQVFEKVSRLPRHQQEKIFDLLQPFIKEHLSNAH